MTRHAKISARLSALVILACGLHAPNCLADGLSVSGSVDLTVVSSYLEGNQLTYNLTGTSLDLTWVTPPQLLSVSVHPLAIGGPQRRWGDPTVWDSPALFFANAVTINQTVTGVTTLPPNVSLFEETANSLKNLGPTEQTLTITPFSVRTLYFTVSLNVEVPLKFNVTLPTGADILMDQSPVILERLTVSSGANLIANSTVIIRHDLTNSGVIAGLGASIGGAFINNSGAMMSVRNLTVDGEFTNTGRITVINGLSRIAPTTNDGPITLAGGQLLFYGGLTDNGGINGYGRLPFSITEHVGITADVSGQTLTIEPAVGPIVINGGADRKSVV